MQMPITALMSDVLGQFRLQASDDPVKTDLELTCQRCGMHVCDVEHGDTLLVLVETAERHRREYPLTHSDHFEVTR